MMRWRRTPRPKGLAGVVAGPQGSGLFDGDKKYATTGHQDGRWNGGKKGWFWVALQSAAIEHFNSCEDLLPDEAAAKTEALSYVKMQLAAHATNKEAATKDAS